MARYLRYAERYYGRTAPHSCAARGCGGLRRQVLARLIEERVVLAYASRRHISLSPQDRMQIGAQLADLSAHRTKQALPGVGIPFIRSILTRQAIIQHVESLVTPAHLLRGPSVHLMVYVIPVGIGRDAYHEALTLATNGAPVPPIAGEKHEWIAVFHVPSRIATALGAASAGQYFGPFRHHGQILVYRLLGRGTHRYSGPARALIEAHYFAGWLKRKLAHERPSCYTPSGGDDACPGPL